MTDEPPISLDDERRKRQAPIHMGEPVTFINAPEENTVPVTLVELHRNGDPVGRIGIITNLRTPELGALPGLAVTPAQARRIAAALLVAADQVETHLLKCTHERAAQRREDEGGDEPSP